MLLVVRDRAELAVGEFDRKTHGLLIGRKQQVVERCLMGLQAAFRRDPVPVTAGENLDVPHMVRFVVGLPRRGEGKHGRRQDGEEQQHQHQHSAWRQETAQRLRWGTAGGRHRGLAFARQTSSADGEVSWACQGTLAHRGRPTAPLRSGDEGRLNRMELFAEPPVGD